MTCQCRKSKHSRLYAEAAVVGISLIPMYLLVSRITTAARINTQWKEVIDLFVSGALFHLVAEETGVNEWYLTNSYAANKLMNTVVDEDIRGSSDWLRDVESLGRF